MKKKSKIKINVKKIALISLHVLSIFSLIYLSFGIYKAESIGSLLEVYMPTKYIIIVLALIFITTLLMLLNIFRVNKKKVAVGILAFLMVTISASTIYLTTYLLTIEKAIQNAGSSTTSEISVVFFANEESEVEKLENVTVGLLNNSNSKEGYIAPTEYLSNKSSVEIVYEYSTWHDLILALANEEVDAIVLPASHKTAFEEDAAYNENIDKFIEIDSFTMTIEQDEKSIEDVNKPFNILLAGTDSPLTSSTSGYLFDVVIIATVDPSSGSIVLSSIPRDSTLYSPCIGGYDKITHNGSYGIECLEETLETTFNITIDYYMIIGFQGVIDIVNYLDGVTITNPYGDIMMQDSSRKENTISIPGGTNLLDGEQTLAFARNRKATTSGVEIDANIRSSNHIVVLKAILERIKEVGISSNLDDLINIVADSTLTNFPINDLASISKIATSLMKNNVFIKTITLEGMGVNYNSPAAGGMLLYGYRPYNESIQYISNYIDMVYNQKFIFMDASTNLSTGAPKVEATTGEDYSSGYYSNYESSNDVYTQPETSTPDSSDTDSSATDSGDTDSGGTDSGGTDSGGTDSGGTDSGGTDNNTDNSTGSGQ
ncbi:MAG: LCP family protein [Bacilli bacterium]